jgi:hypothetical protein
MDTRDAAELEFQHKAKKLSGNNLLAHHLNGIRLAIREHSENTGKWLAAVALAASTPNDNSAEVQKQIDQFTETLKSSTDALDAAVKANQPDQS